jgi:hypothetical protein
MPEDWVEECLVWVEALLLRALFTNPIPSIPKRLAAPNFREPSSSM